VAVCVSLVFSSNVSAQAHATYSGTGDDIVKISKPDQGLPALLVVSGNRNSRHFAIIARDNSGNRFGALVNTTEPYGGIVPVDLPPRTNTELLEIKASGSWRIQVYSIGSAQRVKVPGIFKGEGDNVLWIEGKPNRAKIHGNSASRHFAVTAYDRSGNRLGAIVNTTDTYSGTVIIPSGTLLLKITAVNGWSVDLQ
jgi:hypothetical protein